MKKIYGFQLFSLDSEKYLDNVLNVRNRIFSATIFILSLFSSINNCFSQNNYDGDNAFGNISYCDNYYGNACPTWASDKDLNFNYINGSQTALYFDISSWQPVNSIIYSTTFPYARSFGGNGNGFDIYGKLENNSSQKQTINIPTSFKGSSVEINAVNADMDMNSVIYNSGNKTINIYGPNSKLLTFNNYIEGNGSVSLNINQYSKIALNYDMTGKSPAAFSGGVNINIGEFWIGAGGALNGGSIKVGNGNLNFCKFYVSDIDGGTTIVNPITVPASSTNSFIGGLNTSGTNTLSGSITLNAAPTFENYGGGTLEILGDISGPVAVNIGRVSGTGSSVIKYSTNAKTYTGLTIVNGNATLQLSFANVLPSTNNITVESTGLLKVSANQIINNLDLSAGGNLTVEAGTTLTINGTYIAGAGTIENNGKIVLVGPSTFPGSSTTISAMNDLDINRSAGVTLDKNLTVAGTLTTSSGSIIIPSGISLKQSSPSVSATVKRTIDAWGVADAGWHLLSSPVDEQNFQPNFVSSPPSANEDFYLWDETTNYWINSKVGTVDPFTFNSAFGASLVVGKGYLVSYKTQSTKDFSGLLNVSDVEVSLSYSASSANKGWNLLGNPYSCGLSWDVWVIGNPDISNIAKILASSDGSYDEISDGDIIPGMNGFFVKTVATTSITIPADSRVIGGNWYKSAKEISKISLIAHDLDGKTAQRSYININPDATNDFDMKYDGEFLPFYAPEFYSRVGDKKLSTNSLPSIPVETVIPFGFEKNDATNFSIELKQSIEGLPVYLTDLKTNTDQNLSENPVYTFTSEAGDDPNRFLLHFLNTTGTVKPTASQIKVYSAPGKINISGVDGKAEILVRNMMGQVVMRNSVNGSTLQSLSTRNLPAGVYVVSVVSGKQTVSEKVVVK